MGEFRKVVEAWWECGKQPHSICRRVFDSSPLKEPKSSWLIAFALVNDFATPLQQFMDLVLQPRRGLSQSVVNEKANLSIKREALVCRSQTIRLLKMWRVPVRNCTLAEFSRNELKPTSNAYVPPRHKLDRLFQHNVTEDGNVASEEEKALREDCARKINRIVDPTDREAHAFHSYTPASRIEFVAEQKLMVNVKGGDWAKMSDAWNSQMVPESEVVRLKATNNVYITVKTCKSAFIAWPATEVDNDVYDYDLTAVRLDWLFCFGPHDVSVVPTKVVSPLSNIVAGGRPPLFQRRCTSPCKDITFLDYQIGRGFAFVPEAFRCHDLLWGGGHPKSFAVSSLASQVMFFLFVVCFSPLMPSTSFCPDRECRARSPGTTAGDHNRLCPPQQPVRRTTKSAHVLTADRQTRSI